MKLLTVSVYARGLTGTVWIKFDQMADDSFENDGSYGCNTAVPDKNLVNSILDETEKIKNNYHLLILNGKIKILSVLAQFWDKNGPFDLIP